MSKHMLAGEGVLWVQPDGPNTEPKYLGCHSLDSITEPEGDVTLIYCPEPSKPNSFKVVDSYQAAGGAVTASIETAIMEVADWLEAIRCKVPIYVHFVPCGRKDVFDNWARSWVLDNALISNKTLSGLVARQPDEQSEATQAFDLSSEELVRALAVAVGRQGVTATQSLNDVTFCNDPSCADACGVAQDYCQIGYAVGDADAGASPPNVADVLVTGNGGSDGWPVTDADPFLATEDIASVVCVEIGGGVTRVVVSRGTTDGANPAEIAYSDDGGATWVLVDVGAVDGQYATMGGTLFALDMYHIWLVTTGGYVYFSNDAAVTWVAQHAGTLAATDLNHVDFADSDVGVAVGVTNTILFTADGGTTWVLWTGPVGKDAIDILTVDVRDENAVWIGYIDGGLYYTVDGGVTWTQRTFPIDAGAAITLSDISFWNDLVGWLVYDAAGPVGTMLRTINGGHSWQTITTPTNAGLNALWVCNENLAYTVGEAVGGTGVILRAAATFGVS